MTDTPARALKEAEGWLLGAKHGLADAHKDTASASVCCAQSIHAIIRANDALCLNLVADAMRDKSGADYGKSSFSYEDAAKYAEKTEGFIAMAKDALNL